MALAMPDTLAGLRDRALLLLGFAGAFRRSELVALNIEDLEECDGGMRVRIGRSKTDQEGHGVTIGVVPGTVVCPVRALKDWLSAARITEGPVFRPVAKGGRIFETHLTDKSVANIVKRYAAKLGFDPKAFGGHSLRAGFLTSAAAKGASIFKMMDVSRHKSVDSLSAYIRDAEIFRNHAGEGLL
jgi:integrase